MSGNWRHWLNKPASDPSPFISIHADVRLRHGVSQRQNCVSFGAISALDGCSGSAQDVPDLHFAFPFNVDLATCFALELICNEIISGLWDLDAAARTMCFHATCGVHRIAPQITD